jgi:hypothetical protein
MLDQVGLKFQKHQSRSQIHLPLKMIVRLAGVSYVTSGAMTKVTV